VRIFQSREEAENWLERRRAKVPPAFHEPFVASAESAELGAV
jgi:hypothetical protein